MITSEPLMSNPAACPHRCHLCPHSHSHRVRYGLNTYTLGQRCRLFGNVPLDAVPWRRDQNRAYDDATLRSDDAPLSFHLALPVDDAPDDG